MIREYRIQAELGRHVDPEVVAKCLDVLEEAETITGNKYQDLPERYRELQKLANKADEEYIAEVAALNAKIAALENDNAKLTEECEDLHDKLEAAGKHTYADYERMEAERDAAIEERNAMANAAVTWNTTNLCAFILDNAERERVKNVKLTEAYDRVYAILTPKQKRSLW